MKRNGRQLHFGKLMRQAYMIAQMHRQFDMKQLLTKQDEDTIGEYLKNYDDSHERRFVSVYHNSVYKSQLLYMPSSFGIMCPLKPITYILGNYHISSTVTQMECTT